MFRKYQFKRYDILLVLTVIALVAIGIVAIGSATHINSANGTSFFRNKQVIGFISGFIIMCIISLIDYTFIGKFYWVIYGVNLLLLTAVLIFGDTRWITIIGFRLQPSEFCKILMTLFIAKFIDKNKERINHPLFLLQLIILVAVPTLLIMKQPDLSTSLVLFFMLFIQVFAAGLSYKYIIGAAVVSIPSGMFFLWYIQQPWQKLLKTYQLTRILAYVHPEKYALTQAMQTNNSIQAIGSGQLYGKGLYQGTLNKYNYLPEPQTDFIFSIIGEELGFIGSCIVISLLFILIVKCLLIAKDAVDMYGMLIIVGVVAVITFQVFVNIGVTTGIVPNTGIPLPFISYGLSSLWSNLIGIGIILNISMQRKTKF